MIPTFNRLAIIRCLNSSRFGRCRVEGEAVEVEVVGAVVGVVEAVVVEVVEVVASLDGSMARHSGAYRYATT